MYYKISSIIILILIFVFSIDLAIMPETSDIKITKLTIEESGGYRNGGFISTSYGEILYVYGRRLRISKEAYNEIKAKDFIVIETTKILRLPKRFYINPDNKFYPFNYVILIVLLSFHMLLFGLTYVIDYLHSFLEGLNTIMFFVYIWLMYF
jgi:hypothetical protein